MVFKGRIYKLFPVQSGRSAAGNDWKKQEFVFEYYEHETDRYSDKVLLSVMNAKVDEYALKEGEEVTIGFGHYVEEYQGRWYNRLRVYHFDRVADATRTGAGNGGADAPLTGAGNGGADAPLTGAGDGGADATRTGAGDGGADAPITGADGLPF